MISVLAILLPAWSSAAASVSGIDAEGRRTTVTLIESDQERTVLEISIGDFATVAIRIDGQDYYEIRLPGESGAQEKGFPALPDVRRSFIIPDDRCMTVRLLSSEYRDFPKTPIVPSRGSLPRSVNPADVAHEFASFYQSDGVYPSAPLESHPPYVLRDFRGMVIDANPFQYFPATQTLRVHTRMLVEVTPSGPGRINVLERDGPIAALDRDFAKLYERHFLNFGSERYEPVLEEGSLLIITYDAFRPYVEPLLQWKLQKGIPTRLVNLSEIGSQAFEIKSYLLEEFSTTDLAHVLLVGDGPQIPTFLCNEGGADPEYACLAGGDNYPDIFVGRLSAESEEQVITQVERIIAYERDASAGEMWPQFGTGVASDQGPGHNGEYDNEHMDYIREDLLNYGYLEVDSLYDPWVENWMVAEALNEGRGIVNYAGHGSVIGWSSSGFDTSCVNNLTNAGMLPFVHSVACRNGRFRDRTCFGEEWLRATHAGEPTGAIATYMSSTPQDWDAPMSAQDETIDLLIAGQMRTIGGLFYNGSCQMIDEYDSVGVETFLTWILFGDPSLTVRTKVPETLTATHRDTLFLGETQYGVTVPGVAGALCALYGGGVLWGAATTDELGQAILTLEDPPPEPLPLHLTVTAYNKVTFVDDVLLIPTSGPCLRVAQVEFIDGNQDSILNAGESVEMRLLLRNTGLDPATGILAAISTADEFILITQDSLTCPDIPPGGEAWCAGGYTFEITPNCPDGELVHVPVTFMTDQGPLWDEAIDFEVHAPQIVITAFAVDDSSGGNGNGTLDPGESVALRVTLENAGSYGLVDATGILGWDHPLVHILADTGTHPSLDARGQGELAPPFELEIDAGFPLNRARCTLEITGANGYEQVLELSLPVGEFFDEVESGPGNWTHAPITTGYGDQWHVSEQRNRTPGGASSWKCGDIGDSPYAFILDAGLETPPLEIGPGAELRFWMWIDAELALSYPDSACDGGLVELSLNGGPFSQITPQGGYSCPIKQRTGVPEGPFPRGTPVFSGNSDWSPVTFEVGAGYGMAVFRFRFGSDGEGSGEGWYIDDIEVIGLGSFADVVVTEPLASQMTLSSSVPNPCRASTRISFTVPRTQDARLQIFDPTGRLVRTLVDGSVARGAHSVVWTGTSNAGHRVASGLYYYRLRTAGGARERSLLLLR